MITKWKSLLDLIRDHLNTDLIVLRDVTPQDLGSDKPAITHYEIATPLIDRAPLHYSSKEERFNSLYRMAVTSAAVAGTDNVANYVSLIFPFDYPMDEAGQKIYLQLDDGGFQCNLLGVDAETANGVPELVVHRYDEIRRIPFSEIVGGLMILPGELHARVPYQDFRDWVWDNPFHRLFATMQKVSS